MWFVVTIVFSIGDSWNVSYCFAADLCCIGISDLYGVSIDSCKNSCGFRIYAIM